MMCVSDQKIIYATIKKPLKYKINELFGIYKT